MNGWPNKGINDQNLKQESEWLIKLWSLNWSSEPGN